MSKKDIREKFLKKVTEELSRPSEEDYIINLIRAYYDLKKTINLLDERLLEWVKNTLHLDIKNPEEPIVLEKLNEYNLDPEPYLYFLEMYKDVKKRESIIKSYIEKNIEKKFPNTSYLIGPFIVGMLLERIGSYQKLIEAPASTIQVIGAEKALFKHIRSKGKIKPPKHGIMYLSPWINKLPKRLRGKMARALASKIVIALKADQSGRDIKKEIYEKLEKRYQELIKEKRG